MIPMNLVCFVMYSLMKIDIYKAASKYAVKTSARTSEMTSEKSLKTYNCLSIACVLQNKKEKNRTEKTRKEVITKRKTSKHPRVVKHASQHEPTFTRACAMIEGMSPHTQSSIA